MAEPIRRGYRADIEGLRAVAVLMVLAVHARVPGMSGGFIGVDIFFVLSGYLITGLLVKELERTGRIAFLQFYARRIRRLLPASAVVLVTTIVAARFILPPMEQSSLSRAAFATFAYVSNVYFVRAGNDYFAADSAGNALLHTWSLSVEEQFYLVWPLLLFVLFRVRRNHTWLTGTMATIGALSFAACMWMTAHNTINSFFLLPYRTWEFAFGGAVCLLPQFVLERRARVLSLAGWTGLVAVLVSATRLSPIGFPGWSTVIPVFGTLGILVSGARASTQDVGAFLSVAPLQWIGKRSYALYLWHWPVLVLAEFYWTDMRFAARMACIAVSFVLAAVSYRFVETPVRFHAGLQRHAKLCLVAGLVVMLVGAASTLAWHTWAVRTPSYLQYGSAYSDLPEDTKQGCEVSGNDSVPRECIFGAPSGQKTVVLFGDSHAEQWLTALEPIAKKHQWKIVLYVKSACPASDIAYGLQSALGENHPCRAWRQAVFARLNTLHPDLVLFSSFSGYTQPDMPTTPVSAGEWEAGTSRTIEAMQSKAKTVALLRDTPWARYDVTPCLARTNWLHRGKCPDLQRASALNDGVFAAQRASAGDRNSAVVDLTDAFCGAVLCEVQRGGVIVYRDSSHVTTAYMRATAGTLEEQLLRIAPAMR